MQEEGDRDMKETILVVDDEQSVADMIEIFLENDGYMVHKCYNGKDALKCVEEQKLDMAILDVILPDIDGFQVCKKIRENFFPIIMLTAKVEDTDKVMGLTMGADDYIVKPFNPFELTIRVKTQLRRYKNYNWQASVRTASKETVEYEMNGLLINRSSHRCFLDGKEIALTRIEFSILWYLMERRGEVVRSDEIFEKVWGEKYYENNSTVIAHIGRLREKLKEPAKERKFIKTVWGVGYKIE